MISATPNRPTARDTKLSPMNSSRCPKVKRGTPEVTSCPTVPRSSPSTIIASALRVDPLARAMEAIRPRTTREKYSAGPNCSASDEMGTANSATTRVPTVPAKKDPRAAVARAFPARPLLAIS